MPQEPAPARDPSRRDFLRLRWVGGRGQARHPGDAVPLGSLAELRALSIGTVRESPPRAKRGGPPGARLYLVRLPEGLLALSARCPGDDCLVVWREGDPSEDAIAATGRFYCPCDASIYDRRGLLAAGPSPRPLDAAPVEARGGGLWADSSRLIQRDGDDVTDLVCPL